MKQYKFKEALIAGCALFAMLFGGGNIIFPPYVGVVAGEEWFLTFLAYFLADIGLAIVALIALLLSDTIDRFESIFTHLGPVISVAFIGVLIFCVCTVASPRTCTISYEIAIKPILGEHISLWLYSACYFGVVWIFCMHESKIIDYIGKILTPVLVISLLAMIVMGILHPLGPTDTPAKESAVWYMGLMSGYQTMDCLAIPIFSYIVARDLTNKGFGTTKSKIWAVSVSSVMVLGLAAAIYGGMCYVGATASSLFGAKVEHGELLRFVFTSILGEGGSAMLGAAVGLACLTTGIALTGAVSTYVSKVSRGKIGYNLAVTVFSAAFAVAANIGLSNILAVAVPIILVLFPATLAMILLSLFHAKIGNPYVYRMGVACAVATGLLEVLLDAGFAPAKIVTLLPLQAHGFGWLVPAILGALVGRCIAAARSRA